MTARPLAAFTLAPNAPAATSVADERERLESSGGDEQRAARAA